MDKYRSLLSEVNNSLKPIGFKKTGEIFYYYRNNNIGLINFQRSKNSSSDVILFTINIGVYSSSLHLFDRPGINSKPVMSDCHWRQRLGFLLPEKQDYWWQIDYNTSLPDLMTEITNLLISVAIPEIEKHISDESLIEYWMNGVSSGLTEQQMYLYLIGLLKVNNSIALQEKVEELKALSRGKPFQQNVNEYLKQLGIYV